MRYAKRLEIQSREFGDVHGFVPRALGKDEADALNKEYAAASSPEERSAILRRMWETCGEQGYYYALREAGLPLEDALFGNFLPQLGEERHAKLMGHLYQADPGDITEDRSEERLQLRTEVENSSQMAAVRAAFPDMGQSAYQKICNAFTNYVDETGDRSILGGSAQNGGTMQALVLPEDSPVNMEQAARQLDGIRNTCLEEVRNSQNRTYANKVDREAIRAGDWVCVAGHAVLINKGKPVLDLYNNPVQASLNELADMETGKISMDDFRQRTKQAGQVPVMTLNGPQSTMGRDQTMEYTPDIIEKTMAWLSDETESFIHNKIQNNLEATLQAIDEKEYGGEVPADKMISQERYQKQQSDADARIKYPENISEAGADHIDKLNKQLASTKEQTNEIQDAGGVTRADMAVRGAITIATDWVKSVTGQNITGAAVDAMTGATTAPIKQSKKGNRR